MNQNKFWLFAKEFYGGACVIIFTVLGNEPGEPSSNLGRGWLYFL